MESVEANFSIRESEERRRGETRKRTEITRELGELFEQIEKESDSVVRDNIADQIERILERGRIVFEKLGKSGKDELQEHYRRLRKLQKTSS